LKSLWGATPAGIATTYTDEIRVSCSFGFVLSPEPCCEPMQADVSNSKVLPSATNSPTQRERNTAFPVSFASDLNAGAIGLVALIAAFAAVVAVLGAIVSIGVKIEKLGSGIDD
jgi:hypothetical protein